MHNYICFSICACHPCAGAMQIFSVSLRMLPERTPETKTDKDPQQGPSEQKTHNSDKLKDNTYFGVFSLTDNTHL